MFQTEIIIFLQTFSNDFLNTFFKLITSLGYGSFIKPFLIIIIFGINYKMGFVLLHLVFWNGISTDLLKEIFALPRPANVDSTIQLLGKDYPNPTPLKGMGAKSFFGLLPKESIEYMRMNHFDSYGFPSGHTSGAVALWGGVSLIFRKRWLTIFCTALILFIPLSRMYLGRHFLADILGGYLVGSFFLFVFYRYIFFNDKLKNFVFKLDHNIRYDIKTPIFIFYSFIIPLLLLLTSKIEPDDSATLLGINVGFFLIWLKGIPDDEGSVVKRMSRVFIVFLLFYGVNVIADQITEAFFPKDSGFVEYISNVVVMALLVWSSTELIIKLRLMKRNN